MRFRFSTSIGIYCLFTFCLVTLLTYATDKNNTEIIPNLDFIITPDVQEGQDLQPNTNVFNPLSPKVY